MRRSMLVFSALILASPAAMACFRDLLICEDGSPRGRSWEHNCEFWPPCPKGKGRHQKETILNLQDPSSPAVVDPQAQRGGGEE